MGPRRSFQLLGRRISAWTYALIALVVIAVVVALAFLGRDDEISRPGISISSISVGDAPQDVDVGSPGVWVVNGGDRTLQRIDPDTGDVEDRIELDRLPGGIAVTDDALWVGFIEGNRVQRVDLEQLHRPRAGSVEVGRTPQSIATGTDAVWVASFDEGSISKLTMQDDRVVAESFEFEDAFPSAIATGFGSVWITDVVANRVIRMDEVTGIVTEEIPVGDSPTAVTVGTDGVWVANFNDATVTHIDPATNRQVGQPIIVGGRPGGIAAGEGFVWVTRPESDSVIRIDPIESEWTGEVFDVGDGPQGIAAGAGNVWTADQGSDTITRLTLER